MAKAAAAGHRVVLVLATRGEHGEVPEGYLDPGESVAERREQELAEAARILGVQRVEFLGYVDSGMTGTAENDAPECFWRADVEEAAVRLARILDEEDADVLTVYDDHGVYGHPDHVQVHRVGVRAAALAGTPRVYESTIDRDRMKEVLATAEPGPTRWISTRWGSASQRDWSPPGWTCGASSNRSAGPWPPTPARSARRRSSSPWTRSASPSCGALSATSAGVPPMAR